MKIPKIQKTFFFVPVAAYMNARLFLVLSLLSLVYSRGVNFNRPDTPHNRLQQAKSHDLVLQESVSTILMIDDFSASSQGLSITSEFSSASVVTLDSNILGGVRGAILSTGQFSGPTGAEYNLEVDLGVLMVEAPVNGTGSTAILQYDADVNVFNFNTTGLGSVNLEQNYAYGLHFIAFQNFGAYETNVTVTVFSNGYDCTASVVTTREHGWHDFQMEWELFYPSYCDFSRVGAITMSIELDDPVQLLISEFGTYGAAGSSSASPTRSPSSSAYYYYSNSATISSTWNPSPISSPSVTNSKYYSNSAYESPAWSVTPSISRNCYESYCPSFSPTLSPSVSMFYSDYYDYSLTPSVTATLSLYYYSPSSSVCWTSLCQSTSNSPSILVRPSSYQSPSNSISQNPTRTQYHYSDFATIDYFSASSNRISISATNQTLPASGYTIVQSMDNDILGNERDLQLIASSGNSNSNFTTIVDGGVSSSQMGIDTTGTIIFQYDGMDNSMNLNPHGLGSVNFLYNSLVNSIRFAMLTSYAVEAKMYAYFANNQVCINTITFYPQQTSAFFYLADNCDINNWEQVSALQFYLSPADGNFLDIVIDKITVSADSK